MKTKIYLLAVLVLLTSCSGIKKYLIKPEEFRGWTLTNWEDYKSEGEFKSVLKENYNMYNGYGLTRIINQELSSPDSKIIKIEMYFTDDKTGARGLYRRYQSFSQIPIGEEGSDSPGFVSFYRGNCFVKVTAQRNLSGKNLYLKKVAKQIDKKLFSQ
ncbi:MAG: hypothetical protein DRP89_06195 [Candidatus Neomarinimicrobiota bacterium]|nr:MAG: hypothetical protein DRP89_06195 [Candidatus Neomarinimicrobiota bacterium]